MQRGILATATDPLQWDKGDVRWKDEGDKNSPNRQLFLKYLRPVLSEVKNEHVLDIGSGLGWLCDETAQNGGKPVGIEPSVRNAQLARKMYPTINFVQLSLHDFVSAQKFGFAFAVMVLEYFLDLDSSFEKIVGLLKSHGRLIVIVSDFDRSTSPCPGYSFEAEPFGEGEVAIRINADIRFGIMCDLVRTLDHYEEAAKKAGLTLRLQEAIVPSRGHPRYKSHKNKTLFHLLEFVKV